MVRLTTISQLMSVHICAGMLGHLKDCQTWEQIMTWARKIRFNIIETSNFVLAHPSNICRVCASRRYTISTNVHKQTFDATRLCVRNVNHLADAPSAANNPCTMWRRALCALAAAEWQLQSPRLPLPSTPSSSRLACQSLSHLVFVPKKAACVRVLVHAYYIASLCVQILRVACGQRNMRMCPVGAFYMNGRVHRSFCFGIAITTSKAQPSSTHVGWNALLPDTPCQPGRLMEPSCGGQA